MSEAGVANTLSNGGSATSGGIVSDSPGHTASSLLHREVGPASLLPPLALGCHTERVLFYCWTCALSLRSDEMGKK